MRTTADRIRELFAYAPDTGLFTRIKPVRGKSIGNIAGAVQQNGYIYIKVDNVLYKAHRLAWLHTYGKWPSMAIDHVNGIRADNRIINLRLATRSQNSANSQRRKDNTSGFKGVHRLGNRWVARIQHEGMRLHLGMFETAEGAHAAYTVAAIERHSTFARVS